MSLSACLKNLAYSEKNSPVIIDREAGEIIRLLASVRPPVCPSIQNGWVFKMVADSTGCAIADDDAFN